MKIILQSLILFIAAFAIYGTYGLVLNEWKVGNICPKIIGMPACYIVLICFSMAFLTQFISNEKSQWIYFFFVGLVTLIAVIGTIGEITGMTQCPRTPGGIPMCYISLAICFSLLLLKFVTIKLK